MICGGKLQTGNTYINSEVPAWHWCCKREKGISLFPCFACFPCFPMMLSTGLLFSLQHFNRCLDQFPGLIRHRALTLSKCAVSQSESEIKNSRLSFLNYCKTLSLNRTFLLLLLSLVFFESCCC